MRQMLCPEHSCEQNDDTAISIIGQEASACIVIMDFYGVCEQRDKSSYAVQDTSAGGISHCLDWLKHPTPRYI